MIISSNPTGMGDILLLTSIAKQTTNCTVNLQPKAAKYARFFRDIADVNITDSITPTPDVGNGHYAQRKLLACGLNPDDYFPYVSVSEEEINQGKELIKKYKNPVAFVGNCSKQWCFDREPSSKDFFQKIINELIKDHTVLQFGLSNNITMYENTVKIIDIDIDQLIQYYAAIGKYFGVDTGDSHLMLAVGGVCSVFIPKFSQHRSEVSWNYKHPKMRYYYYD